MTALPAHADRPGPATRASPQGSVLARCRAAAPSAAVVATVVWWATVLPRGTGGREPQVLSIGCVLLVVAMVAVRPWRVLPAWVGLLSSGIGVAAFGVVALAPSGTAGLDEAASYTFAAQLFAVLLAWARTEGRRVLLLASLVLAGGYQFSAGWLAWWGHQDVTTLFQGTYYWHNQVGIVLAAGAVAGAALVGRGGRDPLRLLGWCLVPLCVAGTVFSSSRGAQIGLALGLLLLVGTGLARQGRRCGGVRVAALVVVSWLVTLVLTGPPFFSDRFSATAATSARGESFVGNGVQRLEDWRRAWEIFTSWPVTGAGFNSYSSATSLVTVRRDSTDTAFAHNGFLQVLADGGLLLGVPVLTAIVVLVVLAARALPSTLAAGDWVQPGAAVVLLVLLLHSGMDFDWTYPALLSMVAVVGAVAIPRDLAVRRVPGPRSATALSALAVALLLGAAIAGWAGGLQLNVVIQG